MTRKRFIKLVMAKSTSRNVAEAFAMIAQARGISYAEYYEQIRAGLCAKHNLVTAQAAMNKALESILEAAQRTAKSIVDAVAAIMAGIRFEVSGEVDTDD